tara:strand:- start:278 stop:1297 length:1020 start_codon:yes stop_codon:yes gene_type:complete
MRYIGSKQSLLERLSFEINLRTPKKGLFCDLFSGSAAVARYFKRRNYQVVSNDIMHFSYYLQAATIELNFKPEFKGLNFEPISYLNKLDTNNFEYSKNKFVLDNYSPSITKETGYFTTENALKIDAIRQQINIWLEKKKINKNEYVYLVAALIEAVPFVSNTTGTYGAYLKKWDKRAFKPLLLTEHQIFNNGLVNKSFCENANNLIKKLEGEIIYVDPPYNGRQYGSNYHVLETIARYDNPTVKGITSMRDNSDISSNFCMKSKAESALNDIIANSNFRNIFFSYNSEGILSEEQIKEIFISNCKKDSVELIKIPYRRYKRNKTSNNKQLFELLFIGKK